ncbi:MAG: histidine phosphatase family protein [Methanoregulaceae archaeon]|nr:histidine phosphatase family protein [Methanoregulaceae archaeon]
MIETKGRPVFHTLRQIPERERTVILIRHSNRPSFEGVPYHIRPHVELTPEGVENARRFGSSLAPVVEGKRIHLLHTPATRCRMTAMAIREGLSPGKTAGIGIGQAPQIADPVRDLDQFRHLNEQYGWHELIRRWLDGQVDDGVLWNASWYSDELLKQVLNGPGFHSGEVRIVVAHDITLFPLIHTYFGRYMTTIDYLHGIVVKADTEAMEVGFEDTLLSLGTYSK